MEEKRYRQRIPQTVRNIVWRRHAVRNTVKCWCCRTEEITQGNFDCGHIEADSRGGEPDIANLRPICRLCNTSMGTKNMQEFIDKLGLWELEPVKETPERQLDAIEDYFDKLTDQANDKLNVLIETHLADFKDEMEDKIDEILDKRFSDIDERVYAVDDELTNVKELIQYT